MSKTKKRILVVAIALVLVLVGTVATLVMAADVVPMPVNKGVERTMYRIYELYKNGEISQDTFESYITPVFDISSEMNEYTGYATQRYTNMYEFTKANGKSGLEDMSLEVHTHPHFRMTLYGSAFDNNELQNNFQFMQSFFLTREAYYGMYYNFSMYDMAGRNLMDIYPDLQGPVNRQLYTFMGKPKMEAGHYYWGFDTNGRALMSNYACYILDESDPGKQGWYAYLKETGSAEDTTYQLYLKDYGGDKLRPANKNIDYELLERFQLEVTMKSIDARNGGRVYTIPAKAVNIDNEGIYFDFYGDTWVNMEDQVQITGIKALTVLPEGEENPSFEIYDMYSKKSLTDLFGITATTPITDFAGNSLVWGTRVEPTQHFILDRQEAVVTEVRLGATNFVNKNGGEADWSESFSGEYDSVYCKVVLNEELLLTDEIKEAAIGNVYVEWNIRNADGTPARSKLEYFSNERTGNGVTYTVLSFEWLSIEPGMTPQGAQIVVDRIVNEHLIYDRVGNNNLQNEILMTGEIETSIWPEQVTYLDTEAPRVTLEDTVVRSKVNDDTGALEAIRITVPFKVTDYIPEEGMAYATAAGTTGRLALSNPLNIKALKYRYTITQSTAFPEEGEADWYSGVLGSDGWTASSAFGIGRDGTNLYLHMELANLADYEIDETKGLNMFLLLRDMADNYSTVQKNITITGVDNVAPALKLYAPRTEYSAEGGVTFAAVLETSDTNGISYIGYRWEDPANPGAAYTQVTQEVDANGRYPTTVRLPLETLIEAEGEVNRTLQAVAYDKMGNSTEYELSFTGDLSKVTSRYSTSLDMNIPSKHEEMLVYKPVSREALAETASTRVTVVFQEEVDYMPVNRIFFRVLKASEIPEEGLMLLDPNAQWYEVGNCDEVAAQNNYIYQNVTPVEGIPGWAEHYGDLDIYIASCMSALSAENGFVYPYSDTTTWVRDPSYSGGKIGTVAYTARKDDAYTLKYDLDNGRMPVMDAYGAVTHASIRWEDPANPGNELYRYVRYNQTIAGVHVDVTLENTYNSAWGYQDIDLANSYAVLVRANADGTLATNADGSYVEVTARQELCKSVHQTLMVPAADKNGNAFTTGAYTWIVHVAHKGGGSQDLGGGRLYLLLDAASVPAQFGVLSHEAQIQVVEGYSDDRQYVTASQTAAAQDKVLQVVNIGVARPTELLDISTLERVEVDGISAYMKGVTNSIATGNVYYLDHEANFTISAVMGEDNYGVWLDEELGNVAGIRFWNKDSAGEYTSVNYVMDGQSYRNNGVVATFSTSGGTAKLDVTFNGAWYLGDDASDVYSEEALAALGVNIFGVKKGSNTICYQLILENGKESPVYQFKLNLIEEVPEVEVDFEIGPYYTGYYDGTNNGLDDGQDYRSAAYVDIHFTNILSNYSGLKVYHLEFVEDGVFNDGNHYYSIHQLTAEELASGYRITNGCYAMSSDGYYPTYGYSGTAMSASYYGFYTDGSQSFFVITDDSGNAVTIYPFDSMAEGLEIGEFALPLDITYDGIMENHYIEEYNGLHTININDADGYYSDPDYYADEVRFVLDESEEIKVNTDLALPNSSGVAVYYSGRVYFGVPYDPEQPEGTMITHSAKISILGEKAADGEPNFLWEDTVTFETPNTKPTVVSYVTKAGALEVTYSVPVVLSNGGFGFTDIVAIRDSSLYGTDYAHTFTDLVGDTYTETLHIDEITDPTITYSTTEPTTEPVTVTVTSSRPLFVSEEGTTVETEEGEKLIVSAEGVGTGNVILEIQQNTALYLYYDENLTEFAAYVEVGNIFDTLVVDPYISWDYTEGDVVNGVVYGEVTAYLTDRNGAKIIDPATGEQATFLFYPGGPTSYTFTGCYTDRGTAVADVTAELEVTLEPIPMGSQDTKAPDVDAVAYMTMDGRANPAEMVYRSASGRFIMKDYTFNYGSGCYYSDMNELIANLGWADSYMFHLDVYDEHKVKLILRQEIHEENITYQTASETIEGVSLVGRTLEISKNAEFALYLVDEKGNVNGICFKVTTLDEEAPLPEIAQVLSQNADGEPLVRVYLLPPQLEGYENLKMLNLGAKLDEEEYEPEDESMADIFELYSDYFGFQYMEYDQSGEYRIEYAYDYRGQTWSGSIPVTVEVPDLTPVTVTKTNWSAGYYKQAVNQQIVLQLTLNKAAVDVSGAYLKDGTYYALADSTLRDAGLVVTYFEDRISVIYENNSTALTETYGPILLKLTAMDNNQVSYHTLPEVKNIDLTAPTMTDSKVEYSEDRKVATVILTTSEPVASQDMNAQGTEFRFTVRENGTYRYGFADQAGNLATFQVEVTELVTEPLTITLSTTASEEGIITDPATFQADVGQTLYARINRDATVSVYGEGSDETSVRAAANTWVAVTVTENSMGMHPSVIARDNYGNIAIVQMEYIPVRDITAPVVIIHKELISVGRNDTEEKVNTILMENILYSDDTTAMDDLTVIVDYDSRVTGRTVVTYTVIDEEGNATVRQCWLRIRNGLEPEITVNGTVVDDGTFLYIPKNNNLEITVNFSAELGEPYKLVYEKGDLRSWAKLKDGIWLTAGYDDDASQTFTIADMEDGWYTFALTTQGMEVYYFQIHIGGVS